MAGSIAKRPDGKWRARYRDESSREHARHFTRKIDAQRWLDEISASLLSGAYVDPQAGRVPFRQLYEEWSARQLWVASTRANADLAVRSTTFADVPVKAVRRSHVESWVKTMSDQWAPTTVKTRFAIVRSVFRAAMADRLIATNPTAGVALPRRRKGEAAAIQLGDIDFLRRQLVVTRQLQREGGGSVVRAPKYGSERVVHLPDELVGILGEHVAAHLDQAEPSQWLFTVDGEPLDDNAITWRWRAIRSAAKLSQVRLHDLRHFYASGLIAAGCDVVTVQRALGHSTATTTLDTYSHLWPTAEDRTRAAAAGLMRDCGLGADLENQHRA